jgi:hypothetical protein
VSAAGLTAAATLELWERVEPLGPVERAVELAGGDEAATLPLGQRDARLLRLRTQLAGGALEATASCPRCGELVEFSADPAALPAGGRSVEGPWRLPDSRDLAAAADAGDAAAAERVLLERCTGVADPPEELRRAVAEAIAAADPLAEVLVDAVCPACSEAFVAEIDVAAFVSAELRMRAERLLRDVDTLARAYGWSEGEVLALGEGRRAAYLRLVGA